MFYCQMNIQTISLFIILTCTTFLIAVPVVTSAILHNGQTYSTFLSVNQSASVSLTCNINSSPEALTVTWIKDSSGMTSIVHASPSSPNLDKASVTVSDSGDYICNVTNAVGWSIGNMVRLQVNQSKNHLVL